MSSQLRQVENKSSIQKQIADLRKQLGEMASVMQYAMSEVQKSGQRLSQITAVLNGVVEVVGQEDVQAAVTAQGEAIAKEQAENAKASLAKAVEAKKLLVEDVITEDSIIEAVEFDEKGAAIPPGYFQFGFASLVPALKEKWLGKKKGEKLDTATDGHTAEVLGIYKPNPEPPKEVAPAPEAPAVETPAVDAGSQSSPVEGNGETSTKE